MGINFCSLASGSSGNCQYIASGGTRLLLDAGLSGKYIKAALENIDVNADTIDGILVTHEHSDHIKGVGILMRRHKMPLYVTEKTWEAMNTKIGKIDPDMVNIIDNGASFAIKDIVVTPYEISHDAADPVGYTFKDETSKIGIVTDLGVVTESVLEAVRDCDLLMLEANHDEEMLKMGSYPYYLKRRILSEIGHLSNDVAGEIATEVIKNGSVSNILLGHISKENNFPELAYETVKGVLAANQIEVGVDVNVDMTYRDRISRLYKITK